MPSTEPAATHLIFVRHGQSLANRDGDNAGADTGLTELGWRQSQLVAAWLADAFSPQAIVSSHLIRAVQTAEVIAQRFRLPVTIIPELAETETSYWEEFPVTPPDHPLALWDAPWQPTPQNAPVYTAFQARLRQGMEQLLARFAGQTVIVVSHGGSIGTIVRSLFGGHQMPIFTENTSVTYLIWQEGRWLLRFLNSQTHLAGLHGSPTGGQEPSVGSRLSVGPADRQLQTVVEHFRAVEDTGVGERELGALVTLAAPTPDMRMLDVGTGVGAVALAFAPYVASVVGIDVSPAMLERAERARLARALHNVHFRWGEAASLPFADRSFDLITARDLLHYLAEPEAVFARLRQLLVPTGRLVLDDLIGSDDPVKRATQEAIEIRRDPAFVKLYQVREIERLVTGAQFRIERVERYEVPRTVGEWLAVAAADEATRSAVRAMLEAGLEADASGLQLRRARDGTLTFIQRRLRLLARPAGELA